MSGYLWTSATRADESKLNADKVAAPKSSDLFAAQRRRKEQASTFNHNSESHRGLNNCQSCHNISVSATDRDPNVKNYPGHRTCIDCHVGKGKKIAHNFADETIKRFDAFCGICHAGMPISLGDKALFNFKEQTRKTRAMQAGGSDFMTAFSHESHYRSDSPVRKTIKLEM